MSDNECQDNQKKRKKKKNTETHQTSSSETLVLSAETPALKEPNTETKKKKKKKLSNDSAPPASIQPTDVTTENGSPSGRKFTVSVALPGSILENAQSPELRTYLAGQVARALVIFNVDEVIIFNESTKARGAADTKFKGVTKGTDSNIVFARILQYLECPQYLRKDFFPVHPDLKYAGLLNPLDCPHHMRIDDVEPYREGVVLDRPVKEGRGSFVNAGMRKELRIDRHLRPGVRVTVQVDPYTTTDTTDDARKYFTGTVVSPETPRASSGIYWGYAVRAADSFGRIFTQCPWKEGYDLTIGTSERGENVDAVSLPKFSHLLIVFGGLKGLEFSLETDESLPHESDIQLLFDRYVNACPGQGSRTIRTEEAILVALSALHAKIGRNA